MPIYDFECKNNHITETVVSYDKRKEPQVCNECEEPAYYQLTYEPGTTNASPALLRISPTP